MQRLNDSIFEITGKNEPTVGRELLNETPKCWLCGLCIGVVKLIQYHHLLYAFGERHRGRKVSDSGTESINVSVLRAVHHNIVATQIITQGSSNRSLATTRSSTQ
jgi:hypothetical protein